MTSVTELHDRAMALADAADAAKRNGLAQRAVELFAEALIPEQQAAMSLITSFDQEPTRSVLFRSAAALAIDAGVPETAERLIGLGLGGTPPKEIASELRDLLERVNFLRHLELRGVELEPEEVQISIAGSAVDYGMASSDNVVGRVKVFEKWIKQTAARKATLLDWTDDRIAAVKRSVAVYMSIPRPASFAISLRVGKPSAQQHLRFDNYESGLIDEILDEIQMVNEGREDEIAARVGGDAQAKIIIGYAKALAPDNEGVETVGFTILRAGKERRVAFRRQRSDIRLKRSTPANDDQILKLPISQPLQLAAAMSSNEEAQLVRVRGQLRYADATGNRSILRLLTKEGLFHNIIVPAELVDAIVRPHWAEEVVIIGHATPDGIEFEDIERV